MAAQYVKDIFTALKRELIRYRAAVAALFAVVLLAVLYLAVHWPRQYIAEVTIIKQMDEQTAQMPAADGARDNPEAVKDLIFSRQLTDRILLRIHPGIAQMPPQEVEREVEEFRRAIEFVEDPARRDITHLTIRSATADQAEKTRRAVVDVFIEHQATEKQKSSRETQALVDDHVAKYQEQLTQAEEKLKQFQARNESVNEQAVKERIARLTGDIDRLQAAIDESKENIRTIKVRLEAESQNPEQRSPYDALTQQRQALTAQLEQLRLNYQDSYPDIVALKSQIREVDQAINQYQTSAAYGQASALEETLRKQQSAAESELRAQMRRLDSLRSSLAKENKVIEGLAANQRELADLTRAYDVARQAHEETLAHRNNGGAAADLSLDKSYEVLEPPVHALQPAGVSPLLIYLAAPLLALAAPISAVAVLVVLGPRLRSPALLSKKLPRDVPLLVVIPHRGAPLVDRLLRRDFTLLALLAAILLGIYGFALYKFQSVLLAM